MQRAAGAVAGKRFQHDSDARLLRGRKRSRRQTADSQVESLLPKSDPTLTYCRFLKAGPLQQEEGIHSTCPAHTSRNEGSSQYAASYTTATAQHGGELVSCQLQNSPFSPHHLRVHGTLLDSSSAWQSAGEEDGLSQDVCSREHMCCVLNWHSML